MAKTIFEEMDGAYVRQGDYLLPCLSLPAEKENKPVTLSNAESRDRVQTPCPSKFTLQKWLEIRLFRGLIFDS